MLVPVMDIRIVRMRVSERRMDVQVSVRFGAIPIGFMAMLVVGVVNVRMRVLQALVQMQMLVHFGQVQPHAPCHQSRRDHQPCAHRLVLHNQSDRCTEERGHREVRSGPRRTEIAQSENEECEADTVAHETDGGGSRAHRQGRHRGAHK